MEQPSPPCSSPAVQLDAIEGSKENIQPFRRGHNPRALVRSLQPACAASTSFTPSSSSSSSSSTDDDVATQRVALESAILSYEGPDPLHPWLQYVQWTLLSYPSLSQSSHLLPLLEKCTRTFLTSAAYANDRRYVRVWLLYAERCPQPGDVFQFMHSKGIGAKVAARFVEWSAWHERLGRLQDAEAALQSGIDCLAQPANTLRIALRALNARNAARVRDQLALQSADGLDPLSSVALQAMDDGANRRALSSINAPSSSSAPAPAPQPFRRPTPTVTSTMQIPVYADSSASPQRPRPGGGWSHLADVGAANKENVVGPSTWTVGLGKAVKAAAVAAVPTCEVEVWKDEECERKEREQCEAVESAERAEAERRRKAEGLRQRMEAATKRNTSHNQLTSDPLRNMQKRQAAAPTAAAVPAPPPATFRPSIASHGMVVPRSTGGAGAVSTRAHSAATAAVPARLRAAQTKASAAPAVFNDFA